MGRTYLAYACALVLLCPLALSRPDAVFGKDQVTSNEKIQNTLIGRNEYKHTSASRVRTHALRPPERALHLDTLPSAPRIKRQSAEFDDEVETDDDRDDYSAAFNDNLVPLQNEKQIIKPVGSHFLNRILNDAENNYQTPSPHPFEEPVQLSVDMPKALTTEISAMDAYESTERPSANMSITTKAPSNKFAFRPQMRKFIRTKITPYRPPVQPAPPPPQVLPVIQNPSPKQRRDLPPIAGLKAETITAYVGTLFVYKVPEETFIDDEDGTTRNLSLSLRFGNRKFLPPNNWLQFEETTQEIYGIPAVGNIGVEEYVLTATDKNKGKAHHIVNVNVTKGPELYAHVEFYISMEASFVDIAYDAKNKRKLVENIAYVFGHNHNTSYIRISSLTDNPTTVKWYNATFPRDRCPQREINEIVNVISGKNKKYLKESVEHSFDEIFGVMSIKIVPVDKCVEDDEPTREIGSLYSSVAARIEPSLGASGIVNVKVGERKLFSFVVPSLVLLTILAIAVTIIYSVFVAAEEDRDFVPCLRVL